MNRKQLLIGLVVIAVVAVGVAGWAWFASSNSNADETPLPSSGPASVSLSKDDRTLGTPKAPLTVVEYAAPICPHCAHFDMDIFPSFKQRYIDTGKVFYIFRVFPLASADIAAESIARCLPEDNYFQFLDLLYRNQPKWDPEYRVPDVHAGLVEMGRIVGMTPDQVDRCIGNQAEAQRIEKVGQDAQTKYGINGTPTFIINGQIHGPFEDFQEMQSFIDPMLAKK